MARTNSTDPNKYFSTNNGKVAKVDRLTGEVTGVSAGTANISINTINGSYSATVTVTGSGSSDSGTTTGSGGGSSASTGKTGHNHDYAYEVFELVNAERRAAGVPELEYNYSKQSDADTRAEEIVTNFSHFGTSVRYDGENIAKGQGTPSSAMDSWMNSSGHKKNILNSNYGSVAVGCYESNGTHYWVQVFYIKSASAPTASDCALSTTAKTIEVGDSFTLSAQVDCDTSDKLSYKWTRTGRAVEVDEMGSSYQIEGSDNSINITGVSTGTETITCVIRHNGNHIAQLTCTITVVDSEPEPESEPEEKEDTDTEGEKSETEGADAETSPANGTDPTEEMSEEAKANADAVAAQEDYDWELTAPF